MINRKLALDFSNHTSLTLGILSDTHGSLHPDIADHIKPCDIALHAGDIMGTAVLNSLQPKLGHTIAVKGNNDAYSSWDSHDHELLNELPDLVELTLPGGKLVMEHSHRMWDRNIENIHQTLRAEYPCAQLVVYGHTHIRAIDYSANPHVVNPGVAGEVRVYDCPSCLQLSVNTDKWEIQPLLF